MKNYFLSILITISVIACNSERKSHINESASVRPTPAFSENPLLEKVFTTSININDSTISTLYGNKIAWGYALANNDAKYPAGAILYKVTWKQKPDSLWFGANVPKDVKHIERIIYNTGGKPIYELYNGSPLRKELSEIDTSRILFITSQKMATSP